MLQDFNTRAFILMLAVSAVSIGALHAGFGNIYLSLIDNPAEATKSRDFQSDIVQNKHATSIHCSLQTIAQYDFCGLTFHLGEQGLQHGLDLTKYDSIILSIKYSAPIDSAKLKVILRNYNSEYSSPTDKVSLKFNSLAINPKSHQATVTIPLNALQVDTWWIEQYNIGFNHSQLDLSNIAALEFITQMIPVAGDYKIRIEKAVLSGKIISETELLKALILIWLVCAVLQVSLQRNKLKRISMTDPLTGIFNRRGIKIWINKTLSAGHAADNLTMVYIDIDDFKKVNDTYGHIVGDQLLWEFSDRIMQLLQIKKKPNLAFARLSGDEFMLLCKSDASLDIDALARRLLAAIEQPIQLGNQQIQVKVSIGIAQADTDIKNFEDLLIRADSAMYYAKKSGKNQYTIFDQSISNDILFRKQTAEKIKNAILHDQFHLAYMPIVDSKTLQIVSVELLLRCHAENFHGIGPDIFIPIAEEYDLINSIDLWVIEAGFKQIAKEKDFLAQRNMEFCINISANELHNPHFSEQLQALLELYQISPSSIKLEITETSLVETDDMSIKTLQQIRALGVTLALDDFGTGYTAFSQLINYPVNCLKIDKSFIDNLATRDKTQATMIKAIIAIAKSYQLTTIAEGVETAAQYQYLATLGCDMMQGYLFAKPMPWNDFKKILDAADSPWQSQLITGPTVRGLELTHS